MILPDKLQVSLPASALATSQSSDIIEVLHSWITRRALGEVLIDVADYTHVPGGPGIVLVGLDANYMLQDCRGELRLACFQKRASHQNALLSALGRVLRAGALLQTAIAAPKFRLDVSRLEVTVVDRRVTDWSNFDPGEFVELLGGELERVYAAGPELQLRRDEARPTVAARWSSSPHVSTVLHNIDAQHRKQPS